jgi:hypothetical protein
VQPRTGPRGTVLSPHVYHLDLLPREVQRHHVFGLLRKGPGPPQVPSEPSAKGDPELPRLHALSTTALSRSGGGVVACGASRKLPDVV